MAVVDWWSLMDRRNVGYRTPVACAAAGITFRRCDYWDRTDLVSPSVRSGGGSGTHRLYSADDITRLALVGWLLDSGITLPTVRPVVAAVEGHEQDGLTVVSDGTTVRLLADPRDVVDALPGPVLIVVRLTLIAEQVRRYLASQPAEPALMWAVS